MKSEITDAVEQHYGISEILSEFKRTLTLLCQSANSDAACCVGLPKRQQVHCKQP